MIAHKVECARDETEEGENKVTKGNASLLICLLFVVFLSGCFRDKPGLESVLLWGPESVQAGRTVQLRAEGVYTDGSHKTYGIQWRTSNQQAAKISEKGVLTALEPGVAIIEASKDGISVQRPLVVDPVYDGVKIHFRKPSDWDRPNLYLFDEFGARVEQYTGEWTGAPMEQEEDGWYVYAVEGVDRAKAIFNDGNRQDPRPQSPGYSVKRGEWWYDGAWHQVDPTWNDRE